MVMDAARVKFATRILFSVCIALALLTACSCGARQRVAEGVVLEDPDVGMDAVINASARVVVFCHGEIAGYGSAVAVSPRMLITAKHVAEGCPGQTTTFVVTLGGDSSMAWFVVPGLMSDTEDVAQLVVVGGQEDLGAWAEVADYAPRPGQPVYVFTGDMEIQSAPFVFKAGYVSAVQGPSLLVSIHGVPGNSGCGLFDSDGRVVGILWGGRWDARQEFAVRATLPSAWRELMPGGV